MFMIMDNLLLTNNDGSLSEIVRKKIIQSLKIMNPKSALSLPAYFNKHQVSYEIFPEAWDYIIDTFAEQGEEIDV